MSDEAALRAHYGAPTTGGGPQPSPIRTFESGATRSSLEGKPSYTGFMSPLVVERFGRYMLEHQHQADGALRSPDNWKKGIPTDSYMDSALRHLVTLWLIHEGYLDWALIEDTLCALKFNVDGYMHEVLNEKWEEENV